MAHLSVERQAIALRAVRRVCVNELVVEKDSWFRNKVEQGAGVRDIWDLKELDNEEFGEVYSISKSVGMDLLQLVHNSLDSTASDAYANKQLAFLLSSPAVIFNQVLQIILPK
ncbi:hypothetical protein U1Q18_003467 [Sarracenia purpurea var. burkii]